MPRQRHVTSTPDPGWVDRVVIIRTEDECCVNDPYAWRVRDAHEATDYVKILPDRLDSDGGDVQPRTKSPLFGALLQDWQDFDVAVHALGVALGVFPLGDGYFWTDEVQGAADRGLAYVLTAMRDVGILEIQGTVTGPRVRWASGPNPGIRVHPSLLGGAS